MGSFVSLLLCGPLAHTLGCRVRGISVHSVNWLDLGGGRRVTHEQTTRVTDSMAISLASLLVNTVLAIALFAAAALLLALDSVVFDAEAGVGLPGYALLWLAVSVGWHAFPSFQDLGMIEPAVEQTSLPTQVLLWPVVVVVLYMCAFAELFWLDAVYAGGLGIGVFILLTLMGVPF